MGLQDRDYWKERARSQEPPPRAHVVRTPQRLRWLDWRIWMAWLVILAAGVGVARVLLSQRDELPFPATGAARWYVELPDIPMAPLTLNAPAGRSHYLVRLDDWSSGQALVTVPVRAGESARLEVPLGRYRMTVSKGTGWRGYESSFAHRSRHQQTKHPLEFFHADGRIVGHIVTLETLNGAMEMEAAR